MEIEFCKFLFSYYSNLFFFYYLIISKLLRIYVVIKIDIESHVMEKYFFFISIFDHDIRYNQI